MAILPFIRPQRRRVLVTGGAGFIGSHVVDALVTAGHHVVVVDSLGTGKREQVNPAAQFYELDIRDPRLAEVFERESIEVVSHHAAQVDVRRSTREPQFDAEVNILGSLNVLARAIEAKVRKVVYISTGGAVYGEPEYLPVDESHPINPLCEYGASKHTVEHYLYMYAENYGLDYTVLRYPNVYGPRQDPHGEAGVVAIFAARMLNDETCTINGDGQQERDFLFVGDCARANVAVLGDRGSHGVFNLGSGIGTSVNTLFASLAEATLYTKPPVYGPAKVGETYRIYLDATRARTELGWVPTVNLDDGLAATVAWLRGAAGN
jgi:UDP-glucose 4-epimerase